MRKLLVLASIFLGTAVVGLPVAEARANQATCTASPNPVLDYGNQILTITETGGPANTLLTATIYYQWGLVQKNIEATQTATGTSDSTGAAVILDNPTGYPNGPAQIFITNGNQKVAECSVGVG